MTTPTDLDEGEASRLTAVLLEKATELITTNNRVELLQGLCRSLVEASPHILLAWVWIGPTNAQEVIPQIAVGPAKEYTRSLKIRRGWITQLGPVFQVLSGAKFRKMNISRGSLFGPWRRAARRYGFQTAIALRLPCPDAGESGVIVLYGGVQDYFQKVGESPFLAFARTAQSMLHQCQLIDKLKEDAATDDLTGLPNRRGFRAELQKCCARTLRSGYLLAVGMLDLDNLKIINDRFGHETGDILLQKTAQRVSSLIRDGDVFVRWGGDEFGLIITDLSCVDDLESLSERILNTVKEPITPSRDLQIESSASLGWVLYPLQDDDPDTLIRYADQALYTAKNNGRDQYFLHSFTMDEAVQAEAAKRILLEQALQENRLILHYQPIVSSSDTVRGVEALLRLQHPEQGLLAPAAFFSALDHPRLARSIGRFVLDAALRQGKLWQQEGLSLRIAVNISTRHLLDTRFLQDLQEALARYPSMPPEQLEIEITESAPSLDLDRAQAILHDCQRLGVRIALDDFGTGNASLTHLQQLPAQSIKIDQSFVRDMLDDPTDLAITAGVITTARMLGMEMIAEGVESAEHAYLLKKMGSNHLQGYYFSRPLLAEDIPAFVARFSRSQLDGTLTDTYDLDPYLEAHILRMRMFLRALHQKGPFPAHVLEEDAEDHCHLGLWLRGEGALLFSQSPDFTGLLARHERLHQLSRKAKSLLDAGAKEEALRQGDLLDRENRMLLDELLTLTGQRQSLHRKISDADSSV